MITSQITHGRTIITYKPFQKSLPYKKDVMYLFIVDQCCKEDMDSEVFSKMLQSLKEIGKSALTTGLEVLQDVSGKGREYDCLAFLDNAVSRMAPRKSHKR